jgi:hypothetical protein
MKQKKEYRIAERATGTIDDFKCSGCGGTTVLGYCLHGCDDY